MRISNLWRISTETSESDMTSVWATTSGFVDQCRNMVMPIKSICDEHSLGMHKQTVRVL